MPYNFKSQFFENQLPSDPAAAQSCNALLPVGCPGDQLMKFDATTLIVCQTHAFGPDPAASYSPEMRVREILHH